MVSMRRTLRLMPWKSCACTVHAQCMCSAYCEHTGRRSRSQTTRSWRAASSWARGQHALAPRQRRTSACPCLAWSAHQAAPMLSCGPGSVSKLPYCAASWRRRAPARVDSAGLGHRWPLPTLSCGSFSHGCVSRHRAGCSPNAERRSNDPGAVLASRASSRKGLATCQTPPATGAVSCKFFAADPIGGSAISAEGRPRHAGTGLGSRARRAGTRRRAGAAPRASGPAPAAAARRLPTHDLPRGARAAGTDDASVELQTRAAAATIPGGARGLSHAHTDGHCGTPCWPR